jgi:hypothetical protein
MALAAYHLALGLPGLFIESRPLAPDPPEFADYRQAHGLVGRGERRGHPHPPVRGITTATRRRHICYTRFSYTLPPNLTGGSRSI